MALLGVTSSKTQAASTATTTTQSTTTALKGNLETDPKSQQTSAVDGLSPSGGPQPDKTSSSQDNTGAQKPKQGLVGRRFSFQSLVFKRQANRTAPLSPIVQGKAQEKTLEGQSPKEDNSETSKLTKRAWQSALFVRNLIVGPTSEGPKMTAAVAKPELKKVKSLLLEPKKANELINQLRKLPARGDPSQSGNGPIHAVCLSHPDEEEAALHFEKLASSISGNVATLVADPDVVAPLGKIVETFKEMHIINLVTAPDLGLGQPGNGEGLLAGALPTAKTVIEGFEQVTPQLMALGFATGKLVAPDHKGINPPVDRMSVLTYWWGLELLLPPPSLRYLSNAESVSGTIMNFLTAFALVNNGVREILPFIRYFSQFIDFEFDAIKSQDHGQGVVCAATWIMPAAMIPRPWDFPIPKAPETSEAKKEDFSAPKLPLNQGGVVPSEPLPKPANPVADIVTDNNPSTTIKSTPTSPSKPP